MKLASKRIKIIIADDHPVFRSGMEGTLKGMRIATKISQASDGKEVIQLLNHEFYDLVLMDISMRHMDGVAATEIINRRFPFVKVIALSMHEDAEIISDILNKGASGYLIKNADKEVIKMGIDEVMSGRKFYSPEVSQLLIEKINKKNGELLQLEKDEILKKDRFRELLFLICHDFSNLEIAEILFLSERTIEDNRKQLKELTGHKKTFGLVQYAIESGILNDTSLKRKFVKQLTKLSK